MEHKEAVNRAWQIFSGFTDSQKETLGAAAQKLAALKAAVDKLAPALRRGDVDIDDSVTVSDVVALRGLIVAGSQTDAQLAAGDLDGSKTLTVADVVALRSYIVAGAFA